MSSPEECFFTDAGSVAAEPRMALQGPSCLALPGRALAAPGLAPASHWPRVGLAFAAGAGRLAAWHGLVAYPPTKCNI